MAIDWSDPTATEEPIDNSGQQGNTTDAPPVSTPGTDQDIFGANRKNNLSVPENIASAIAEAVGYDKQFGHVVAAVIYQRMRWGTAKNPVTSDLIQGVADAIRERAKQDNTPDPSSGRNPRLRATPGPTDFVKAAAGVFGGGDPNYGKAIGSFKFTGTLADKVFAAPTGGTAAPTNIQDVYDLFNQYYGRPPKDDTEAEKSGLLGVKYAVAQNRIIATAEAKTYREESKSISDVRSWAQSMVRQYTGKSPTVDELKNIVRNGWNPDQLKSWLRDRPYGSSTLGALSDLGASADTFAKKFLGRRATPGEINWMLSNLKSVTNDDVSGFYEQLKQRQDIPVGQPGHDDFAWVADPTTWLDQQRTLQKQWSDAGLHGEVDPRIVNTAITGNWSTEDAQSFINSQPAPGYPADMQVGEVNRIKSMAAKWKDHYFPGEPLTKEEILQFRNLPPEAIPKYFRAQPMMGYDDGAGNITVNRRQKTTDAPTADTGQQSHGVKPTPQQSSEQPAAAPKSAPTSPEDRQKLILAEQQRAGASQTSIAQNTR